MSQNEHQFNQKRRAFLKSTAAVSGASALGGYLLT